MAVEKSYESTQIDSFAALVSDGTYACDFDHAPQSQEFFCKVMSPIMASIPRDGCVSVLDCGCGNGAWLDLLSSRIGEGVVARYFGYDLTPPMVEVASQRLASLGSAASFQAGNILDHDSYRYADHGDKFDLIFTYDVVQQLPRKLQYGALETMLAHLTEGGTAVVFDNDCHSDFGRMMGRKKFLTRYFGLKLVPRYYCNASYPPLAKMAAQIEVSHGCITDIKVSANGMKRALIIKKAPRDSSQV